MFTKENEEGWITSSEDCISSEWLTTLFPTKDPSKIILWLELLRNNEFESFQDLQNLDESGWNKLELPIAIVSGIKNFLKEWSNRSIKPATNPVISPLINQVDCVVIDISGSMKSKSHIDRDKTREDVSKILFHSLMDKLVSLELSHAVGLLAFGSSLTPIAITREYERFHDELGRLDAREGSTRLYDAVLSAAEIIEAYVTENMDKIDHTQLSKRVFVFTDGEDNASNQPPFMVANYLQEHNILLDALPVASRNSVLHALTAATGGLCFDVESEEQGMSLFESEATLHVHSREVRPEPSALSRITDRASFQALVDQAQSDTTARVREVRTALPTTIYSPVLSAAAITQVCNGDTSTIAAMSKTIGEAVTKRILREYTQINSDISLKTDLDVFCSIDVNAEDLSIWKVWFKNLPDPYTGGTWLLMLEFPSDYPFKPPKIRFMTPIYHCNISSAGGICLDVLKDNWSPAMSAPKLLLAIHAMLLGPNGDDPLDAYKGQVWRDNRVEYLRQARLHTAAHASESMEVMMAKYNRV